MSKIGKKHYPIFPVDLILKDKFNTLSKLKNIKSPTIVLHGKQDKIVPFAMGKEIFDKLDAPKFSYFTDDLNFKVSLQEDVLHLV